MLSKLNALRKNVEQGFTLIELLVVIVIIGVLAAIALPIFMNQQKAAVIASVKSDVRSAQSALLTYLVKNPTATDLALDKTNTSTNGALATTIVGETPLSQPANQVKIRSASSLTAPGTWDNYLIIGWNNDITLSQYRFTYNSTTGKYVEG